MCSCVSSDSGLNTSVKCYYTTFSCQLSTPILSNFQNPSRDTHYAFAEHGDGDDCSRDATGERITEGTRIGGNKSAAFVMRGKYGAGAGL